MAKTSGLAQQFYAHGYDLSGDVGALNECGSPREVHDVTGINKSALERLLGRGDGILEFATFFNDAAGQEHAALKALPTGNRVVLWAFGGAAGKVAAMLTGKQVNYDWKKAIDGSLLGTVRAEADGVALEWGVLLTAGKITHAAAASAASKDDAASSASGAAAALELVSLATGTVTVLIEHSVDNAVWATLITFTAVAAASAPTAERKTVAGTVNRYLRATTTGTFTNAVFIIAYRRGTAQDDVAY